ncbi:hypothetical protein CgunFtcFv8_021741 [Champsocephalus gunnari]|uniref:Uncharacterized protein n=1 Tax=Champsocephalus gunnari TaxID=52237 RepID=A0AAN8DNK0_CHAGU|nr:hypothetical protein CgunFtcFv8_021741 [Champsocephalus gunnari]
MTLRCREGSVVKNSNGQFVKGTQVSRTGFFLFSRGKMENYKVTVFNGSPINAVTTNDVFIKLVGTDGEIEPNKLNRPFSFTSTQVACPVPIGKLILIKLVKKKPEKLAEVDWFPAKVEVESNGETHIFPIYRWITDSVEQSFKEGTALRASDESTPEGRDSREKELNQREKDYCWDVYKKGIPHIMEATDVDSLPSEVRFSYIKSIQSNFTAFFALAELKFKGIADSKDNWTDIDDIKDVFLSKDTKISKYVEKNWKEDAFFGSQYLNGVNPILIRRCTALPENFPVTDEMLFPDGQSSLADEMEKGNIFLLDYKLFDGLTANIIHEKQQYLMAPLVLLQKTPDDKLMPIAIQLKQTPAEDNPIFLPTDSEYDWLMAKMFVRSADSNEHQLNVHLLRTHLLAEVYAVSLLRNFPMVHPLYKLLVPHTRYTLHINFLARDRLLSEGFFDKYTASGGESLFKILEESTSSITYSSLCMPDDIAERGMEDVPNYYYRDDGLKLWVIIQSFVQGVLSFYYKSDDEVQQDSELQKWCSDIFEHGFLSNKSTGIPQHLSSVTELVKFVTMVIFTCSAQHSAVNDGQFDYGGWMPNSPFSLQLAPPTTKGTTSEDTMLNTLPDIGTTAQGMATLWLLSKRSFDFVRLGQFPEEHFSQETPCELIKDFQKQLEVLSAIIRVRNIDLDIPYKYMDPALMENSVAM